VTLTGESSPQSPLEVRLLGGFDVRVADKPLPSLRSRREQWLLALLVLRHDRDTARDWLATTLWPDNEESQALFYLRKSLSNLRQALGTESARLLAPTPRTVRLDLSGASVDVVAFDAALKRASGSASPVEALEEAAALYRGALLPDCLEEWAGAERNQREEAYLGALEALGNHYYGLGDPTRTVHWLRLLIAADPYRESASGTLMQALAEGGDLAAVTVVYQELRARLRQDLNASPSPQTEALYRQLIQPQNQAVAAPAPAPSEAPATRRHLPVPLSDLIGREEETREILEWMKRRRLLTLLGTGGIGKTRLAIAVAEAAMPRFEQGVWFVDLAPLSDPAHVPQAAAKALGIAEEPGRPLMETLIEGLSSRSLLLVLDNCEHLLDACAELAHTLLTSWPTLSLLATSRQALNVMGEQVYAVPSLPVPPMERSRHDVLEKDPHFLMEYEAIRLFVDRATRVNSAFRLNRRSALAVVEICRQLDGIPLAIEMAAARLRSLSVGEIQARLADRFRLLTSGNRGVLPRQQTLRAAIDWSYDQLSDEERTLLCRLSVFAGGWTPEAAESVCGNDNEEADGGREADGRDRFAPPSLPFEVAETLASLVDKSLVLRRQGEEEAVRYGMLETIRQYGVERLEERGERPQIRRRHRDYFLQWVGRNQRHYSGPGRLPWLLELETEHDDLRHALTFCLEDDETGEEGLLLAGALWRFWLTRGPMAEGSAYFTALLARPGAQTPTQARSLALNGAGVLALFQGNYASSRALHEEGLKICRESGDRTGMAFALSNLGNVFATQSDYASARLLYTEGLEIFRELGDREAIGNLLNNLSNITMEQCDYDAALPLQQESLEICRAAGNKESIAQSLNNLGILAEMRNDLAAAAALYEESRTLFRELGARMFEANNLAGLGNVALRQGDYASARALYEESLAIRQEAGDRWGIASSLHALGAVASHLGEYTVARSLYFQSLTMQQELEDRKGIAGSFESLASLALHEGDPVVAARLLSAASALRTAIGAPLPPYRREEIERELALVRTAIGEDAFAAAWEEGRAMSLDEAVGYALER